MSTEISKTKKIATWVIAGALTALFLFSAFGKFAHPENMTGMHLQNWKTIIPIGEIISALLFLFPKTNKFGVLLLSSYLGGAIIIHMTNSINIGMPTLVLLLVWVVGYLRNPELFKI